MNRLVIIGNGFDLAHGLKTSYKDFIEWYWEQRTLILNGEHSNVSEDVLCKMTTYKIGSQGYDSWHMLAFDNSGFRDIDGNLKFKGSEVIDELKTYPDFYKIEYSPFFNAITQSIETKGWVDIENEYYRLLKEYQSDEPKCKDLNHQLNFLKDKLIEYLNIINKDIKADKKKEGIEEILKRNINPDELEVTYRNQHVDEHEEWANPEAKEWEPKRTMLLSFNYTETINLYRNNKNRNYIHGALWKPNEIIFGYGDELERDYKDMVEENNPELLRNAKSVRYMETSNYHDLLNFLESAPFQVFIMGHSCGNSDRTLLNTIFEHRNCTCIKPFYYKKADGTDNYIELVQNIYRNFTDMKLMRNRVVDKTRCETM